MPVTSQRELVRIALDWRAEQAGPDQVTVTLVVAGQEVALGSIAAVASEDGPGTPASCAIRRADATATAFGCGAATYLVELRSDELVISLSDEEVKRLPVTGDLIVTKPYRMPIIDH